MTEAQALQLLAETLAHFQGREYPEPIGAHTWFFADLGFTSIDAVILGETLETQLACKLPFATFLAELAKAGAEDLNVGQLAHFLAQHVH